MSSEIPVPRVRRSSRNGFHRRTKKKLKSSLVNSVPDYVTLKGPQLLETLALPTLEGNYDEIFDKKWILKDFEMSFNIPPKSSFYSQGIWTLEPMKLLKDQLDNVKSLLNDLNVDDWHQHTRNMNPLFFVMMKIRKEYSPEFCTTAWCKLFELLSCHSLLPFTLSKNKENSLLNSVHLCEAPGAFVSALNHFVKTRNNNSKNQQQINWDFLATTLNPHNESNDKSMCLHQDDLILSTLGHWTFLEDDTGNIMDSRNVKSLLTDVKRKFGNRFANFVTADGSIDCAESPYAQEVNTGQLHFCEMVAALTVLEKGGSFVLKMFTFFECNSISLLYLLCCFFGQVKIVKPGTSKEGNSEVYVLCLDFLGQSKFKDHIEALLKFPGKIPLNKALLPLEMIPPKFLNSVVGCSFFFASHQVTAIRRNIKYYPEACVNPNFYRGLLSQKFGIAKRWLQMTRLSILKEQDYIFHLKRSKSEFCFTQIGPRMFGGSYNDRLCKRRSENCPEWITTLWKDLEKIDKLNCTAGINRKLTSCLLPSSGECPVSLKYGKPFDLIRNSRFCSLETVQLNLSVHKFLSYCSQNLECDERLSGRRVDECDHGNVIESSYLKEFNSRFNVVQSGLKILWYNQSKTYGQLMRSDYEVSKEFLKRLDFELKNLEKGQNIFLCKYPLLSRLDFGVLVILAGSFKDIRMIQNSMEDVQGILLKDFEGVRRNGPWEKVQIALRGPPSKGELVEIVPITILCRKEICGLAVQYNGKLLERSMKSKLKGIQKYYKLFY